jgi:hypothetical protein
MSDVDWNNITSLEPSVYRGSLFFEFFGNWHRHFLRKKAQILMDLNFGDPRIISKCLRVSLIILLLVDILHGIKYNFRLQISLADGKRSLCSFERYTQVFDDKHGFIQPSAFSSLLLMKGNLDYQNKINHQIKVALLYYSNDSCVILG